MRTPLTALLLASVLVVPAPAGDLLVTSRSTDQVLRYDLETGAFLGVFAAGGGLDNPVGLTYGPDGNLYVASALTDQVLRYDGASGAFLGVFAQGPELDDPRQLQFGPGGDLFVASAGNDRVLRYAGDSGAFRGVFVSGSLDGPNGITFGPGGDLFVAAVNTGKVRRYDGLTGQPEGNFAKVMLSLPHDVSFGPDGRLYVTNAASTRITRYDGTTGDYVDDFVVDPKLEAALGMTWLASGDLLVVNQGRDEVRVYDGASGALVRVLVAPGSGGLKAPLYAVAMPDPGPALSLSRAPGRGAGGPERLVVRGAAPGAALTIAIGSQWGPAVDGLRSPLLGTFVADEGGQLVVALELSTAPPGTALVLQAVDGLRQSATPPLTVLGGD